MTAYNKAIFDAAGAYIGLSEWPGAKHNPEILRLFDDVGQGWVKDDETPWCAAFVGSILASVGLPHTGKLNARSYLTYGQSVRMEQARAGDIVVLWRGSRDSWQGHVGLFVRFEGNGVVVRGGNQGNAVSDQLYPLDRLLAIRRADGVEAKGKRPVLRKGDSGAWVHDLQLRLSKLGYTHGKNDGVFGTRTLAAVVAFQSDNHLEADGIVGDVTWVALDRLPERPLREVTEADLSGSRTLKTADEGKNLAVMTAGIGVASSAVAAGEQAYEVVQRAGGLVDAVWSASPWLIALAVLGVVGYMTWRHFQRVKELRIEDARTGANDSK